MRMVMTRRKVTVKDASKKKKRKKNPACASDRPKDGRDESYDSREDDLKVVACLKYLVLLEDDDRWDELELRRRVMNSKEVIYVLYKWIKCVCVCVCERERERDREIS